MINVVVIQVSACDSISISKIYLYLVLNTQRGGIRPKAMIADPSIAGIDKAPDPSNALKVCEIR